MAKVTLSNKYLDIVIANKGAELKSIKYNGVEFLWQGGDCWQGSAPILFPICGALKGDTYIFNNKEYNLPKHGFIKDLDFKVVDISREKVVYSIKSNAKTLLMYPFEFELYITYSLIDNAIFCEYLVKNIGNKTMYYSIGAHEGYLCTEGAQDYYLQFEKAEQLIASNIKDSLIAHSTYKVGEGQGRLALSYDYFAKDALLFAYLKSRAVMLANGRRTISVEYPDFDYFLVWTVPNAPFVCLEPWSGLPDLQGTSGILAEKKGINALKAKTSATHQHKISFDLS